MAFYPLLRSVPWKNLYRRSIKKMECLLSILYDSLTGIIELTYIQSTNRLILASKYLCFPFINITLNDLIIMPLTPGTTA